MFILGGRAEPSTAHPQDESSARRLRRLQQIDPNICSLEDFSPAIESLVEQLGGNGLDQTVRSVYSYLVEDAEKRGISDRQRLKVARAMAVADYSYELLDRITVDLIGLEFYRFGGNRPTVFDARVRGNRELSWGTFAELYLLPLTRMGSRDFLRGLPKGELRFAVENLGRQFILYEDQRGERRWAVSDGLFAEGGRSRSRDFKARLNGIMDDQRARRLWLEEYRRLKSSPPVDLTAAQLLREELASVNLSLKEESILRSSVGFGAEFVPVNRKILQSSGGPIRCYTIRCTECQTLVGIDLVQSESPTPTERSWTDNSASGSLLRWRMARSNRILSLAHGRTDCYSNKAVNSRTGEQLSIDSELL